MSQGRLLQDGKEIGAGEYTFDSTAADVRRGEIKLNAAYGARINGGYGEGDNVLVLETNTERFELTDVSSIGYFDKSQRDIDYFRGWSGVARTVITVKFRVAKKIKNWRPSLLKAGVP